MPTILITGASGGLAQEMVKLLPNDQLILLGRNKEKLVQLYGNYSHAELIEIDITDDSALEALVTDLYLRYGKIDVLINNAGYGIFEGFDQIADKDIHQMFEVNTLVNPGPIRTGFFDQADPDGTYLKSVDRFLLEADAVAKKIVKIIGKNKRELNLPILLNLAHKFYTLFPKLADKLAGETFNYK